MSDFEGRIRDLERRLARTRVGLLLLSVACGSLVLSGFREQSARQQATEFAVVDRFGEVRARLIETGLYLMDESGREALALSFANSRGDWSPGLSFYYPSAENGTAQSRMTLHRNADGGVDLVMSGGTGDGRIEISVAESGEASIVATSPDGRELWRPF